MFSDIRYAFRSLAARPGFTVTAILMLALGIGANTSIFSALDATLLRPLPFAEPDRLVGVYESYQGRPGGNGVAAFLDWRQQNTVFEDIALTEFDAIALTDEKLTGSDAPERILGASVTTAFFPLLGIQPLLGRVFLPDEDNPGKDTEIILSHGFWQRRFGSRRDAIGQSLTVHGRPYTVIGVMPPGFRWSSGAPSEYWVPLAYDRQASWRVQHQYGAIARLKRGVSMATAQAQMSAIAQRVEQQFPATNKGWGVLVAPLSEEFVGDARPALLVLSLAVGFVLLIACANVANLMLARAAGRAREIAIRGALGASRGQIIRLVLAESILLSLAAGALGLILALWGVDLLSARLPAYVDLLRPIEIDGRALAFTLAVSIATGILFGLAPALRSSKGGVHEALKSAGPSAGMSPARGRFLKAVTVCEIALAVILVISGGLLIKSFAGLFAVNLGFRTENLLTMHVGLPWPQYRAEERRMAFYQDLLKRVGSLPGVESAGAVDMLPMSKNYSGGGFTIEGRAAPDTWKKMSAQFLTATPSYFRAAGVPLRRGRLFTDQDVPGSPAVILINETMARRFWPNEDPIGQRIRRGTRVLTIVGIVGDVRHNGPAKETDPQFYFPYAQQPSGTMSLAVRTAAEPLKLAAAVRAEIRGMEREAQVTRVQTMERSLSDSVAGPRVLTVLLGSFAGFALVLAAMGLYGVIAYSVSQRTHELGVRIALGADRGDVLKLVLGEALVLAVAGITIGMAGAFAGTRLLSSLLYRVAARDPAIFVAVPVLLALVALAASYVPARRAAAIEPLAALRCE
ncbi:MAG: ABC transporter permease [Bryobacteraceae bacterium]